MDTAVDRSHAHPRPWLAIGLSLVPGAGQMYNRHWRKGLAFLVATPVSLAPAILLLMAGEHFGRQLLHSGQFVLFLLGSLVALAGFFFFFLMGMYFWASAASDAAHSAKEIRSGTGTDCADKWWFFHFA